MPTTLTMLTSTDGSVWCIDADVDVFVGAPTADVGYGVESRRDGAGCRFQFAHDTSHAHCYAEPAV